MTLECLQLALGKELGPEGVVGVAHNVFRQGACVDVDRVRLAGNGKGLAKLVKIEGLEHVEQALAKGKGAILGSAHFGSWEGEAGLLGARGFPVTLIAYRTKENAQRPLSLREMLLRPDMFARTLFGNIVKQHLRPYIFVDERRRLKVAVEAARVLRRNELIFTMMDVVDFPSRHQSAAPVPFLRGMAYVPPGAVTIAKSTGAPLLICLIHRSSDWRHQVVEISAPIETEGDTDEVNRRCTEFFEEAIRREPAHWRLWYYSTVAKIALLSEEETKRRERLGGPLLYR